MTTPAQLSAQVTEVLSRWNQQQDQLAEWLTGDPSGGPNGDGKYPLTDAEGNTENFLCLPALINQVSGPAAAASSAQAASEAAQALAEAAQAAAELAAAAASTDRTQANQIKTDVITQRDDVAAKWSDVNFWYTQVTASQLAVATAESVTLAYRDETLTARDDTLVARNEAQIARDEAEAFAASINPATLVTTSQLQAEFDNLIGGAPGTLDTLNEIAAALGDDPNFATTVTSSLANKSDIGHTHVISDVTGLQTALDGKQPVGSYSVTGHSHAWSEITGKPTTFTPSAHTHVIADVTGLQAALDGKAALSHTHDYLPLYGGTLAGSLTVGANGGSGYVRVVQGDGTRTGYIAFHNQDNTRHGYIGFATPGSAINVWSDDGAGFNFRNGPLKYEGMTVSVEGHTHSISAVTGLQSALDGKAALSHTHSIGNISGLSTELGLRLGQYTYHLETNGSYRAAFDADLRAGIVAWDTNSTGSTGRPSEFGATWSFRPVAGATASNYGRHFDLFKPSGPVQLYLRGRDSSGQPTAWTRFYEDGYHPEADKLSAARTISLTGDVTGSVSFDGSANVSIAATVADDSHNHVIANVDGLQAALDGKLATTGKAADSSLLDGIDSNRFVYAGGTLGTTNTAASGGGSGSSSLTRTQFFRDNEEDWGALGVHIAHSQSSAYALQIASNSYGGGQNTRLKFRTKFNGTWDAERYLWDSANFDPASKSDVGHTHAIADVTGLQAALDGKLASSALDANNQLYSGHAFLTGHYGNAYYLHAYSHGGNGAADTTYVVRAWRGAASTYRSFIFNGGSGNLDIAGDLNFSGGSLVSALAGKASVSHSHSINSLTDAARLFNNMGDVHHQRTSFDAQGSAASFDYGWRYVQGSTNGPGTNGAAQYYSVFVGLGDNYTNYGMQIAYPRNVADPYISIRYEENNSFGPWRKISAGKADQLATARTISLGGDVSGSVSFDGSSNVTITTTVANDSHEHTRVQPAAVGANPDGVLEYFQLAGNTAINPTGDWYNTIRMGHGNPVSYYSNTLAVAMTGPNPGAIYTRTIMNGTPQSWRRFYADDYHPEADRLTTARTISLSGDVTGSVSFNGSSNVTLTATVVDDSHNHVISNVDGLQAALDGKAAVSHSHSIANVTGLQAALDGKAKAATVSTSAPSGGSDGDVWYQVS